MGCYRPWSADDAAMGWQAIDERGYWDGLTNGNVVTRAAVVICPMARLLLADGTDASPDTGESQAYWRNHAGLKAAWDEDIDAFVHCDLVEYENGVRAERGMYHDDPLIPLPELNEFLRDQPHVSVKSAVAQAAELPHRAR